MARITREQVARTARLARLRFDEDEARAMTQHLESILDFAAQLEEVDTTGVPPLTHATALTTQLRDDEPADALSHEAALANAPARTGEYFAVPKILGSETEA